jgi:hypothetical protein
VRRYLALAVLSLSLSTGVVSATEAPASDAAVRELLEASDAHRLVDGLMKMVAGSFDQGMHAALGDKVLTPEQQKYVDASKESFLAAMGEMMSWEQLEPLYVEVYTQSFSQSEIEGLIAFYRSPAGIAFKEKMPAAMQLTMQKLQPRIATLSAKMEQQQHDLIEKLVADLKKPGASQ